MIQDPELVDDVVAPKPAMPEVLPRLAMTTFVVLFAIHLLDYLDRNILTSLQPQIRADMPGLTNEKWGMLATLFLVSYSVFSPVTGWLGDRYRRTWLLAGGIGIWSLATLGSGLARDYGHLALARSVLGIGEATYGVIAPTILIDLFHREKRSSLMSAFYLAMPLGAALGIMLGPIIAKAYGWHSAFFIVGVPGCGRGPGRPVPARAGPGGHRGDRPRPPEGAREGRGPPRGLHRPDGQLVVHLFGLRDVGLHLRHRRDAGLGAPLPVQYPGVRPGAGLDGAGRGDVRRGGDRDAHRRLAGRQAGQDPAPGALPGAGVLDAGLDPVRAPGVDVPVRPR